MTRSPISRRNVLKGATAIGALATAPERLLAQQSTPRSASGPTAPLPPRGEFIIRGATVLTIDPILGDLAAGDVHVRDGEIVGVGQRINRPNVQVIESAGMICLPGFVDTHWHLWTSLLRPFVRADVEAFGYFPVTGRLGVHYAPEDSYRSVKLGVAEALSAGVTTVHNWAHNVRSPEHADAELSAMRDAGIRGRFAYGPGAGHAGRPADGPRRPRSHQAHLDARRRHAHARHLLAQCRRRQHRRGRARLPLDRHGAEGLGRRPRARPADHFAHIRPEPDHRARAGRPARPRRAARAPAADPAGGACDPQGARGQLFDRAGAGVAPRVQSRCRPARRAPGGRRQGEPVDRPYLELQMR